MQKNAVESDESDAHILVIFISMQDFDGVKLYFMRLLSFTPTCSVLCFKARLRSKEYQIFHIPDRSEKKKTNSPDFFLLYYTDIL